ncbi:hypothetical protein EPUL_001730, partial [Erysiphe pulchra]
MALISAATIITSLSLFHITLAFFFLTSPITIADQTLVFIIGEAMKLVCLHLRSTHFQNKAKTIAKKLGKSGRKFIKSGISKTDSDVFKPYKRSFDNQSPPLAFLAAVLFLLGVSDLVSISKVDEITQLHWGAQ